MIIASNNLLVSAQGWRVFATKRLVRIVPMYWAATGFKLATMLVAPAAVLHAQLDWGYVAKSLLFWPALNVDGEIHPLLGVGWTLIFEMFFYALFTLALLLRVNPVRALVPLLVGLALLSQFRKPGWPVELACWTNPIVLDFAAGMLIARWAQRGGRMPAPLAWAVLLGGAAYLFAPILRVDYLSLAGSITLTLSAAMIVAGAVSLERQISPAIPRIVIFLGAASYALYLAHPLVAPAVPAILARLHLPFPTISIALSVAGAIVAGVLCHLLIEQPATRFLTGLAKRCGLLAPGTPLPGRAGTSEAVPAPEPLRRDVW